MSPIDLIPAPYRLLALALAFLAVGSAGVAAGVKLESNARDAQELKRVEAARQEEARLAGIAMDIGLAMAKDRATADADRLKWEKERKASNVYAQVDCGGGLQAPVGVVGAVRLTADFIRLFDAGFAIGSGDASARSDGAVPGAGQAR